MRQVAVMRADARPGCLTCRSKPYKQP